MQQFFFSYRSVIRLRPPHESAALSGSCLLARWGDEAVACRLQPAALHLTDATHSCHIHIAATHKLISHKWSASTVKLRQQFFKDFCCWAINSITIIVTSLARDRLDYDLKNERLHGLHQAYDLKWRRFCPGCPLILERPPSLHQTRHIIHIS